MAGNWFNLSYLGNRRPPAALRRPDAGTTRPIDLAVAVVMAHARAAELAYVPAVQVF